MHDPVSTPVLLKHRSYALPLSVDFGIVEGMCHALFCLRLNPMWRWLLLSIHYMQRAKIIILDLTTKFWIAKIN